MDNKILSQLLILQLFWWAIPISAWVIQHQSEVNYRDMFC